MIKRVPMETIARAFAALFVMSLGIGLISLAVFLLIALLSPDEDIHWGWGAVVFMAFLSGSGVLLTYFGVNYFRHERRRW